MERIFRWITLGGLFIIPFIPLFISESMFFPYITGKAFAFRIIVGLTTIAWLLLAFENPAYRPKRSPILWSVLAFAGVIGLATIFAENPARSFWSNFERMEGYITIVFLLLYFFVLTSCVRTDKLWRALLNTTVVASMLTAGYIFMQMAGMFGTYTWGDRLGGTLGNAAYLGVYMLIQLFVTGWLLYTSRAVLARVLYGLAMLTQFFVLYQAGTRGTLLGFLAGVGIAVFLIALFEKQNQRLRKVAWSGVIGVLILIVGFFFVRDTALVQNSSVLSRFANISFEDTTTQSRMIIWRDIAWGGFKERPILGWGQDNFIHVFGMHYEPGMHKQEPWFDRAHNVFLDWLIAGGVLGLFVYLSLFIACVYVLWRTSAFSIIEKSLFAGLLVGYFIHNMFVFDNLVSYIGFFTILALIHVRASEGNALLISERFVLTNKVAPWVQGAVCIVGLCTLYMLNAPGIARAKELVMVIRSKNPTEIFKMFDDLTLQYGFLGREEVRERMSQTAGAVLRSDIPPVTGTPFVGRAIEELQKQIISDPLNTRPLYFAGRLLVDAGHHEAALEVLDRALSLNPDRQIILMIKGQLLREMKQFQESFEVFRHVYDISPGFDEGRLEYIIAANILGDKNLVAEQIALLEERVREFPEDTKSLLLFGTVCANVGVNDKAIGAFEKLMELDRANYAERATAIIEALKSGKRVNIHLQ